MAYSRNGIGVNDENSSKMSNGDILGSFSVLIEKGVKTDQIEKNNGIDKIDNSFNDPILNENAVNIKSKKIESKIN